MKKNNSFSNHKGRKYRAWKSLLAFFMLAAILFACQKEMAILLEEESISSGNQSQLEEIQAAKEWFEQQYLSSGHSADTIPLLTPASAGKKAKHPIKARPHWNSAKVGKDGVIEVPLQSFGKISYASSANATDAQLSSAITRMIIVKNGKERMPAFMHIRADSSYLAEKGYDLSENAYKKMKKDFSGIVFYTYLDGQFSNGWRYKDGTITATVCFDHSPKNSPIVQQSMFFPGIDGYICRFYEEIELFRWCWGYEDDGVVHTTGCDPWEIIDYYIVMECVPDDGSVYGDGGIYGGGGGGGSNGGGGGDDGDNTPPVFTITVSANPQRGGTVDGGGLFERGATCTITATANPGYEFTGWTGSVGASDAAYSFAVVANMNFTANFEKTTIYDPCDMVKELKSNTIAQSGLKTLKEKTPANREHGLLLTANEGLTEDNISLGNNGMLSLHTGKMANNNYNGFFHTHHQENTWNITPSANDIATFYKLFVRNKMKDPGQFKMGIIPPGVYGVDYILVIEDPEDFRKFGTDNKLEGKDYKNFAERYRRSYHQEMSVSEYEKTLLQFLDGTGLKLLKGNVNDNASVWKVMEIGSDGVVRTVDCD